MASHFHSDSEELARFLRKKGFESMSYALCTYGVQTVSEVRGLLNSSRASRFCTELLDMGVHNSLVKEFKSCCKEEEVFKNDSKANGPTWNYCILIPFDLVLPQIPVACGGDSVLRVSEGPDAELEFSMVEMCFT